MGCRSRAGIDIQPIDSYVGLGNALDRRDEFDLLWLVPMNAGVYEKAQAIIVEFRKLPKPAIQSGI